MMLAFVVLSACGLAVAVSLVVFVRDLMTPGYDQYDHAAWVCNAINANPKRED